MEIRKKRFTQEDWGDIHKLGGCTEEFLSGEAEMLGL